MMFLFFFFKENLFIPKTALHLVANVSYMMIFIHILLWERKG